MALVQKRSRPLKKGDKDWQDDEIHVLIDLWAKHKCLFNSKHSQYLNINSRAKAIDKTIKDLKEENFDEINAKQVLEKLTKLRNYYGAERRKEENSKVVGSGTDSLYVSSRRFYESLIHYLNDTLTPRATVSNIDGEYDEDAVYQINNPPSAKASRKIREKNRENAQCVMAKASKALESITARYEEAPQERKMYRGEHGSLADMVYEMLCNIPDSRQRQWQSLDFNKG